MGRNVEDAGTRDASLDADAACRYEGPGGWCRIREPKVRRRQLEVELNCIAERCGAWARDPASGY
jgi:hypothetical protein